MEKAGGSGWCQQSSDDLSVSVLYYCVTNYCKAKQLQPPPRTLAPESMGQLRSSADPSQAWLLSAGRAHGS